MSAPAFQGEVSVLIQAQEQLCRAVSEERFDEAVQLSRERHWRLQRFFDHAQVQDEAMYKQELIDMLASTAAMQRQLEDFRRSALDSLMTLEQGSRARRAYDG